jgi:hypothetical protein
LMMIVDSPPDIIAITEVIPKAQQTPISMARISIPNYSPYFTKSGHKWNTRNSNIHLGQDRC